MSQTEVQLIKSSSVVDGDIVGMSSSKLSGALPAISGAALTNLPSGGKLLQIQETVKDDTTSATSIDTWEDISGLSVSITPASASNKILVLATVNVAVSSGTYYALRLEKDGTAVFVGASPGQQICVFCW